MYADLPKAFVANRTLDNGACSPALVPPSVLANTQRKTSPVPARQGNGDEISRPSGLSLIDRARALCAAADDVQRATIEATRRIAAIRGTPDRPRRKKKPAASVQEPPDICARPPSDVPPPKGEGWRRLGPVSVVCGSNRISVSPQTNRRALSREVEVFMDGGCYRIVPADIYPGGGFCVSLDRDFVGETNMNCMLYVRKTIREMGKRGKSNVRAENGTLTGRSSRDVAEVGGAEQHQGGHASRLAAFTFSKVEDVATPPPPPRSAVAALAPFGSVGETPSTATTSRATMSTAKPAPETASGSVKVVRPSSPSFSVGLECRKLKNSTMSLAEERYGCGSDTGVHEAQSRARRRALSERKRKAATDERKTKTIETAKQAPTAADIVRLKASRRAARARVASHRQKAEIEKQQAEAKSEGQRRKREAEAAERSRTLRSVAAARASTVAAEKRQRQRELELLRQAEVEAKRERLDAILAHSRTAQANEREKQLRDETNARIRRAERRRELAQQRQEEERAEKMRLYEVGRKYSRASGTPSSAPPPPAVQSARSFFSFTGSASASETVGGVNGMASTPSGPTRKYPSRHQKSAGRRAFDHAQHTEDAPTGSVGSDRSPSASQGEHGLQAFGYNQQQQQPPPPPQAEQTRPNSRHCVDGRRSGHVIGSDTVSSACSDNSFGRVGAQPGDGGGEPVVSGGLRSPRLPSSSAKRPQRGDARSSLPGTTTTSSAGSGGRSLLGSGCGEKVVLDRRRVATTPVWKRPAVPLSKPYMPVPRNGGDYA